MWPDHYAAQSPTAAVGCSKLTVMSSIKLQISRELCHVLQQGGEYSTDKAKQSADFFTAGVKSTFGTVVQVTLHFMPQLHK